MGQVETADRKIRVSPEVMDAMATRTIEGWRLNVHWGEPDAEGFYTPVLSVDRDDDLVIQTIERVREGLEFLSIAKSDSTILRIRLGDVRALLDRMVNER